MRNTGFFLALVIGGMCPLMEVSADSFALTPEEVYDFVEGDGDSVLFIDVRDPVEIMFIGATDLVDANIPFLLVDRHRWNPRKNTFYMGPNPDFSRQVDEALSVKGLDRDARIVTMCRSGSSRGEPSAESLRKEGFPNAYYVDHGFQGDRQKNGPLAGRRTVNGWQNSGLPWSGSLDPAKIFRPQEQEPGGWLVIVKSPAAETQAMAFVLSNVEIAQGTSVRVLLCDEAGLLAVQDSKAGSEVVRPVGKSPRQMLRALIAKGVTVEVCGVFLPNRGIAPEQLVEGVGEAKPNSIAQAISTPGVTTLTF